MKLAIISAEVLINIKRKSIIKFTLDICKQMCYTILVGHALCEGFYCPNTW